MNTEFNADTWTEQDSAEFMTPPKPPIPKEPSSFTPGPWVVLSNAFESRISPAHGQFRMATLESDNHETDARLMAVAPELLAALEQLLDETESRFDGIETTIEEDAAIDHARLIISKAKGQP